ncbi:MAG: hypothetical protein JWM80_6694 [Cyanobacteria bacterium RYN_339]|nr:hypothetical protein [Cyanobacteria bacterium RYN_339]
MTQHFRALLAVPFLLAALAGPAVAETPGLGVSVGGGLVGPPTSATGQFNTNFQWTSGVHFRGEPAGEFTEAAFCFLSRGQVVGMGRDKVFETSGLALSFGAKAWILHVGIQGELSLLREIVQDTTVPGFGLQFHNGAGFIVEPYAAITLPFLHSEISDLDLSFHYPVLNTLEPSIGPRVMLTLWLGTPAKKPGEDPEKEPDKDPDENKDPDNDDTNKDQEMRPTPKPSESPKHL